MVRWFKIPRCLQRWRYAHRLNNGERGKLYSKRASLSQSALRGQCEPCSAIQLYHLLAWLQSVRSVGRDKVADGRRGAVARVSRVGRRDSLYSRCKTVARRVAGVVQSERKRSVERACVHHLPNNGVENKGVISLAYTIVSCMCMIINNLTPMLYAEFRTREWVKKRNFLIRENKCR